MSRVGKNPVMIPQGVNVEVTGGMLTAKGKLGELSTPLHDAVETRVEDDRIVFTPANQSQEARALWGTLRSVVNGMVQGVNEGFRKVLELNGVGYRAQVQGDHLVLQLGYSHDIYYPLPDDVTITAETATRVVISGASKQRVGQVAAEIRSKRPPEPYKGKGVKYEQETILRKEGKKK